MHEFSFNAPQHPRNAIMNTTAPTTIINIGADQKLAPISNCEIVSLINPELSHRLTDKR